MILRTSLLALALFSFGCGKSEAEARGEPIETAPSASVAVQAAPTPSPKAEGAELLPLAVGQWTRHSVRRADGTSSEMSYKVVGTEGDAFWIEIESGAPGSGTVISLLITLKDRKDPASSDILAARMKLPGQEMREVRGDSLNSTKDAYKKNMAQMFVPGLAGMAQEDVTVPAGTFKGCYRRSEKTDVGDVHSETTLWTHPSVPITGLVRSKAKDGTGLELIAFGLTGAKSSL